MAVDLEIRDLMQLVCPGCGEINLHQDQVEVFFRDDAEIGGQAFLVDDWGASSIPMDGNPSKRRDGLLIRFYCEHCNIDPVLKIHQHKGTTYIEWEK